jgi:hypothetical protein
MRGSGGIQVVKGKIKVKGRKSVSLRGRTDEAPLMLGLSKAEQARRAQRRSCGSCEACIPEVHGRCVWRDGSLMDRHRPDQAGLRLRLDVLPAGVAVFEVHDVARDMMALPAETVAERALEVQAAVLKVAQIMPVAFYDHHTRFKTLAGPAALVDRLPQLEPEWSAGKVQVTTSAPVLYGPDGEELDAGPDRLKLVEVE